MPCPSPSWQLWSLRAKNGKALDKAADCRKLSVCEETNLGRVCSYKSPLKRPLVEIGCMELCAWGIIQITKVRKDHYNHLSNHQPTPLCPLTVSLCAISPWFLNTSRDVDSTTFLGSPFQCSVTLAVKKFLLPCKTVCHLIFLYIPPSHNIFFSLCFTES